MTRSRSGSAMPSISAGLTQRTAQRVWKSSTARRRRDDAFIEPIDLVELVRVPVPPGAERGDHRPQAEAELRCRVFHARRHLLENLPVHDPVLLHLAQLLD